MIGENDDEVWHNAVDSKLVKAGCQNTGASESNVQLRIQTTDHADEDRESSETVSRGGVTLGRDVAPKNVAVRFFFFKSQGRGRSQCIKNLSQHLGGGGSQCVCEDL
jgi:hypothetical protein